LARFCLVPSYLRTFIAHDFAALSWKIADLTRSISRGVSAGSTIFDSACSKPLNNFVLFAYFADFLQDSFADFLQVLLTFYIVQQAHDG
jgi:hypothetical protein